MKPSKNQALFKAQLVYAYYTTPKKMRNKVDQEFTNRLIQILDKNYNLKPTITKKNLRDYYLMLNQEEQTELMNLFIEGLAKCKKKKEKK